MSVIDPVDRVERLRRAQPKRKREVDERVPPGQFITKKFPVLTYGPEPQVNLDTWQLRIDGAVAQQIIFSWEELTSLPTVRIETDIHCEVNGQRMSRVVMSSYSYQSASDLRVHFGVGSATAVDRIRVRWPGGVRETFPGVAANQFITLEKGQGTESNE